MLRFLLPKELDRIPYLFRMVIANFAILILAGMNSIRGILLVIILFLFSTVLPRTINVGWPRWTIVLLFVPYVNFLYSFLLAFVKSKVDREAEARQLSGDPQENKS
jgi:NADH:ubiquinone oxidoreductase subunit 6 (subunit J)